MHEFEWIDALAARLRARRADTIMGIGDDGAIIAPRPGHESIVTTDTLIAGRHFPEDTDPIDIGYKTIAVNLSDLAAMGAEPAWLTLSLAAPRLDFAWSQALVDGVEAAIGTRPIDIIGGDTTRSDVLTLSVTAIGQVPAGGAVRRDRAKPGDAIVVTGCLGDAAAGLELWPQRESVGSMSRHLIDRLCRPTWRNGISLRHIAHAAIDLSDGLCADLGHICRASGVGATIEIDRLPCSAALADYVANDPKRRRRLQATGGDDYELCIALAPDNIAELSAALDVELTEIGRIEPDLGLRLVDRAGQPVDQKTLGAAGWDHFR